MFDRTPTFPLPIEGEDPLVPEPQLQLVEIERESHGAPERALLASLLRDALDCFQQHYAARSRRRRRLFEEAEEWIFGAPDDGAFSFVEVCELLGIDAARMRGDMHAWRERQTADAIRAARATSGASRGGARAR